ncbi:MAG TPA: hypothetical protein VN193_03825 [Candidatus Angelobacter sp.]|jgi:hypothetical protein|nr:hypothetical protein [Candidatus Angelobacter sp.]
MTHLTRAGGAAAGILSLAALAGCGSGSSNSSGGSGSPSATAALDSCLVGTWVSTGVSGTIGGQPAQASGGTGEKVTINNDGTITIDDSNTTTLQISTGGQSIGVKQTGKGSGKATTAADKVTVTLDPGSTLTNQTIDSTGAPVGTPDAGPSSVTATFKCTQGQSLQLIQTTSSGTSTVNYKAG